MNVKTLAVAAILSWSANTIAGDAPTLNDGVDAEVKAAVESAITANKAAKEVNAEWVWADPINEMWTGSLQDNSKILDQVIEMANAGKNEEAKKTAVFIEMSAKAGVEQAAKAKAAGPALYGL